MIQFTRRASVAAIAGALAAPALAKRKPKGGLVPESGPFNDIANGLLSHLRDRLLQRRSSGAGRRTSRQITG
jgi:hypothetical protein